MNKTEYADFVRMVARNALEREASPQFVAERMIVDTANVGDEKALLHSAEPFVDEPRVQTRLWPKDVLTGAEHDLIASQPDDLRDLAVDVFTHDLYDAMMGIENDTATPWGEA